MADGIDLLAAGLLPPVAARILKGESRQLLAPLRYLDAGLLESGELPDFSSPALGSAPDRAPLAAALAESNQSYGHPRAREMAAKLADPSTLVVVTGQQPGLFGGPLYALSKMVAAARWAAELEKQGRPAVAVFWVATEDHDFAEVAVSRFLTPAGLQSFDLGEDRQPLLPVGMRTLGPVVTSILEKLRQAYPGARGHAWVETLAQWYRPDARIGEAFSRLMVRLLGERCPLMLDSLLPALKQAEEPHMERLVRRREELGAALAAAHEAVEAAGLPLQVTPQPGLSPLFLLRGSARMRVEWQAEGGKAADRFTLRGSDAPAEPISQLLETLKENPGVVSPGVLARPAIQDAVLGTTLQILGPGELSYMVQAKATYGILGIPAPFTTLRPQVLCLEGRHRRWLNDLGLSPRDLFKDSGELDRERAKRSGVDPVGPALAEVGRILDALQDPVVALDKSLEGSLSKTRDQVLKALDQLAGRVAAAVARGRDVDRQRLEGLREALLPGGKLQERVLSTSHFPAKFGDGLVEALWNQMSLDPAALQIIDLS